MQEAKKHIPGLLAEMVAADGKVLEVEELNAEALIECFSQGLAATDTDAGIIVTEAKARFFASLKAEAGAADPASLMESFGHLPVAVKLDLFRAIWMIATCDGELHPEEERLAHRFADMIALGRPGGMATQPRAEEKEPLRKAG